MFVYSFTIFYFDSIVFCEEREGKMYPMANAVHFNHSVIFINLLEIPSILYIFFEKDVIKGDPGLHKNWYITCPEQYQSLSNLCQYMTRTF